LLGLLPVSPLLAGSTRQAGGAGDDLLANQPKSEFRERRKRLMEKLKDGAIVLGGAHEEDFGEVGRFRQGNDIMYLTGVQTPAAYLVLVPQALVPDRPAQEILFIPPRNLIHERWTGVQVGPGAEAAKMFGITEVAGSDTFQQRLREILSALPRKAGQSPVKLYTITPSGPAAELSRERQFADSLRRQFPEALIEDVSPAIAEMRKIKSEAEVRLMQKAVDITGEAHRDTARAIRPGVYEYEVQGALEYAFTRNGAERPGFPSIVGSGIYSTILHYNENRKKIEAGETVVVDIGAEYSYYTADITRTYPAGGKFTPRQREIYQLVLDAQRACEKAFKPGQMSMYQLGQVATEVMRKSPLRDRAGNTLERYFIHGLGHWLGMDVHDVGSYDGPLPPGSIITIEPGIYIPEEKLGVRIEDDYLVTASGLIKLSGKIPSDPDAIEQLMASESRQAGQKK
jgi:Xaa-Pro aminopeptidase